MLESFQDGLQGVVNLDRPDVIDHKVAADKVISTTLHFGFMGASLFRAIGGYGSSHEVEQGHLLSFEDHRGDLAHRFRKRSHREVFDLVERSATRYIGHSHAESLL